MNASTLHRRALLGTALAALAGGGAAKADASPPFVLVHGAWHGAWCWQRLTPLLAARGHWSYAPTLSGCGERTAEIGPHITLDTHIDEIVQLLYAHDLRDVVLVGHSYAGAVISGVADRVPQLLRRLVYLDAVIPENGVSLSGANLYELDERAASTAQRKAGILPVPGSTFGIADRALLAWVQRNLRPHPLNTFDQPLFLTNPVGNGVPGDYIACTRPAMMPHGTYRGVVRANPDWRWFDLPTSHDAMVTAPQELATLLTKAAAAPAARREVAPLDPPAPARGPSELAPRGAADKGKGRPSGRP